MRFALPVLGLIVALTGCRTAPSDEALGRLPTFAIGPVTARPGVYRDPDVSQIPEYARSIPLVTGGGVLPALLSMAIAAGVTSAQQREYVEANAEALRRTEQALHVPPTAELDRAIGDLLRRDAVFGSRVTSESANHLSIEITRFGLALAPISKTERSVWLRMQIEGHVLLRNQAGERLLDVTITGLAMHAQDLANYIRDAGFVSRERAGAAADFAEQLQRVLRAKFGPR